MNSELSAVKNICLSTKDLMPLVTLRVDPNILFTPEEIVDTFIASKHVVKPKVPSRIKDNFTPEEILELENPMDTSSMDLVTLDVMGWRWEHIKSDRNLMEKIQKCSASFDRTKISFLQSVEILS